MKTLFDVFEPEPFAEVSEDYSDIFDDRIAARERMRIYRSSLVPSTDFFPRSYQLTACNGFFDSWKENNSTLCVMATGTGKTAVAAMGAKRILTTTDKDFLFLAHRKELIRQAAKELSWICRGFDVGIEMGDEYTETGLGRPRIIVASKDTICQAGRLSRFEADRFHSVWIDEAHHYTGKNETYEGPVRKFCDKGAKLGGLTATPDRADEIALGNAFDSIAFVYDVWDAIQQGYLVNVKQKLAFVESLDISAISTGNKGDLNEAELAEAMVKDAPLHKVAEAAIEFSVIDGTRRQTIIFAASVEHARRIAEILNARNERDGTGPAASIDSKYMDQNLRDNIVEMFRNKQITYLVNYGIVSEGFDCPDAQVVVIARLTKSRALYAQMIGRITRPARSISNLLVYCASDEQRKQMIEESEKKFGLVVDIVGVSGKHKLVTSADILGSKFADEIITRAKANLGAAGGGDVVEEIERVIEIKASEDMERLRKSICTVKFGSRSIDPFDVFDLTTEREPGWMKGKPITDGQRTSLEKMGIAKKRIEKMTRHQACKIIDAAIERRKKGYCTYAQARVLISHGENPNVTFERAKETIDKIAANNWRPLR